MNKYWSIGTGASSYIKFFSKMIIENGMRVGNNIILANIENEWNIYDGNANIIKKMHSKSTAKQYIQAWESMGFIEKQGTKIYVATNLSSIDSLKKLVKINILEPSSIPKVSLYRNSLIINVLVKASVLNQFDLEKKEICNSDGVITIQKINRAISSYEKEVSKDKEYTKILKERYDNEF